MPLLPTSVDYSSKDFDSLRARLVALLSSTFPEWTDFDVAAFGNVLLEMFAFVGDTLLFYQDNQARESRLVTATQRRNIIALAKMLGYKLSGARAATAMITVSLDSPPAARVRIPAGTAVRTKQVTNPIVFQLLADAVIEQGASPATVSVEAEHSKTLTQIVDAAGKANFDVYLDMVPYIDTSAVVSTPQGDFSEVDNFLDSGPNDLHFTVSVDQNDRAVLRFGNGVNGAPPTGTMRIRYKTGGGSSGIVDVGTICVIDGAFVTDNGTAVRVSVTNPAKSSGGTDRQTNESAKVLAPQRLRATERSVAREDFEIHAREIAGVSRALMLTNNELVGIEENTGFLYVIPTGGGAPTPSLKARVLNQVTEVYPCTLTFTPMVIDGVYKFLNISTRVYMKNGYTEAAVGVALRAALKQYFQVDNADMTPNVSVDFGFNMKGANGEPSSEIAWSDIFNVIRDVPGIRKLSSDRSDLLINGSYADVQLKLYEFPQLGNVSVINGDTGNGF